MVFHGIIRSAANWEELQPISGSRPKPGKVERFTIHGTARPFCRLSPPKAKSQIRTPEIERAMPDGNEVERRICEMLLDMGDERLTNELHGALQALEERDRRINGTLEELLGEVDMLLLKLDEIESDALDIEDESDLCIR